ncbi:MAG TPA: hypothetical protein VGD99_12120 [Anaerolineae bacterium]|jgi:excinuclease UvrABC ATPase subunit
MPQEYIEIRGTRENNLKNVSLRIPKRKITIPKQQPGQDTAGSSGKLAR